MTGVDTPGTTTAVAKHACVACGAQAEWDPGKQRLICPYCHTEAPFEVDPNPDPDPTPNPYP